MPTSKINKDAREGKGSKKTLEKKWDESKSAAKGGHGKNNWPLTMYIYKKKTHQASSTLANAIVRLQTTKMTAMSENMSPEADHVVHTITEKLGSGLPVKFPNEEAVQWMVGKNVTLYVTYRASTDTLGFHIDLYGVSAAYATQHNSGQKLVSAIRQSASKLISSTRPSEHASLQKIASI